VLRVAQIVRSVKDFAQPDKLIPAPADLNRAIRSTLTLAHSEYHDVADVETALADLPPVTCVLSEVNQVVLHLVVNAAHAIAEKNQGSSKRGTITIKTSLDADHAIIAVSDDGGGIPVQLQPMIFNPFFTTKQVGRGKGQGLAIARTVVTKQHGGSLTFDSAPGVGTTFYVRLPVRAPETPAG
jgi:two-component system, NtrC family, sensor kinase